ncbi:MAG: DNA polymerase I [Armatimonadetes bacterium]|nr:DNA polymerase I [Armatimonadota bacterium]
MSKKRLIIIDGYSLLFRAFYATRYLSTADGRPTNALHGFTTMMFNLLEKDRPDAIVVALDHPSKTFRHTEYAAYKGTRKETAPELISQLDESRNLLTALGIPQIELVGFEADDIVGTISKQAEENGYLTTIITGDLDSLQLVDECVSVVTPRQGVTEINTYGPAEVVERLGVPPVMVPDFKGIKGDTSDNIPGVPGIGDKGAAELITNFGTVEDILAKLDEIPEKYRKKIEPAIDQMKMSKWLATIIRDVPVEYDFKPFILSQDQLEAAKKFLQEFELKSCLRACDRVLGPYVDGFEHGVHAAVEVVAEKMQFTTRDAGFLMLKSTVNSQPFGIHFAALPADDLFDENAEKAFVSVGREVLIASRQDGIRLFQTFPTQAIVHDAKPMYKAAQVFDRSVSFDSLIAGYVLQSGRAKYDLGDLVQGYTDYAAPESPEESAFALLALRDAMHARLQKEDQLRVMETIELPLTPILAEMEVAGIRADKDQLREFSKELSVAIEASTAKIYELAGQEFTIGSPKQLGEILFDKLGIPGATKTKTGYATGAEILQQIAPTYEIAGEVLTWRELTKLRSTYAEALQTQIASDGRIHTTYSQTIAATGRISSNDPNLQNIPVRTELGRSIRKAFTAADGYALASFDYSQIELRVLAHMCEEPALVHAFEHHEDVHTATAKLMFHVDEPTKQQRGYAKLLNYAVLYGVTDFGLANQLGGGFSRAEAKELINLYNERFPTVKGFTQSVIDEARSKGFTTTLTGRRRYFPDIHAAKFNERQYAERQAMNAPIQGTAADMLKLAMLHVRAKLEGSSTRMLLNVHDELVFELKDGENGIVEPIRHLMEVALPLKVPVEVDAKIGDNWNEMSPVSR